jgi:hypothetical protein
MVGRVEVRRLWMRKTGKVALNGLVLFRRFLEKKGPLYFLSLLRSAEEHLTTEKKKGDRQTEVLLTGRQTLEQA